MTDIAKHSVPTRHGRIRRGLAAVWTFLEAMESTSFNHAMDRTERLEQEVGRLKEEVRQSRDMRSVDSPNSGAGGLDD